MSRTAVIIGDGEFPRKEYPRYLISSSDVIVCCDGAFRIWLRVCEKVCGGFRLPDAVVGDLDSLSPAIQRKYSSIMHHVEEQDDNDQTKAFRYILENYPDVDTIHIVAASGKREDHTIGNLSLLMEYTRCFDLGDKRVDMVSDWGTIFAITDSCTLDVGEGRRFSLISPDNTLRVKSEGLQWKTDDVVFDNWWKATLNRATRDRVSLEFSHPSMALVFLD